MVNPWTEILEGNNAEIARKLGVMRSTVNHWKWGKGRPMWAMVTKVMSVFPKVKPQHIEAHYQEMNKVAK